MTFWNANTRDVPTSRYNQNSKCQLPVGVTFFEGVDDTMFVTFDSKNASPSWKIAFGWKTVADVIINFDAHSTSTNKIFNLFTLLLGKSSALPVHSICCRKDFDIVELLEACLT